MKSVLLVLLGVVLAFVLLAVLLRIGDRAPSSYADESLAALEALRASGSGGLAAHSPAEEEALDRFAALFADFSPENLEDHVRSVYADELFFNDTVKTVVDLETLAGYLVHSASAVEDCTVEIKNIIRDNGDYYLHWVMDIRFKKDAGTSHTVGMTHLRFNTDGRVVYHQDYWDPATGILEYLPVIGPLVRLVKDRL